MNKKAAFWYPGRRLDLGFRFPDPCRFTNLFLIFVFSPNLCGTTRISFLGRETSSFWKKRCLFFKPHNWIVFIANMFLLDPSLIPAVSYMIPSCQKLWGKTKCLHSSVQEFRGVFCGKTKICSIELFYQNRVSLISLFCKPKLSVEFSLFDGHAGEAFKRSRLVYKTLLWE